MDKPSKNVKVYTARIHITHSEFTGAPPHIYKAATSLSDFIENKRKQAVAKIDRKIEQMAERKQMRAVVSTYFDCLEVSEDKPARLYLTVKAIVDFTPKLELVK